jgi:ParB family transcriptional regulator, chromosome partitioning protein
MPHHLIDIPLAEIRESALPRDRTATDPAAMDELTLSIATHGLRQPIEVWALATPEPPWRYGLIAGFRRLAAVRSLGLATIPAFLRQPASVAEAMQAMVSENEQRSDLSPFERARVLAAAVDEGIFTTLDEAIAALHPEASPTKRTRLRAIASVVEALGHRLCQPEAFSQQLLLRIAAALNAGFEPVLLSALAEHGDTTSETQTRRIAGILTEAELEARTPVAAPPSPGRPKRLLRPRPGLTVRRERTDRGWSLHFTGADAHGMMIEGVMDDIERMYGP